MSRKEWRGETDWYEWMLRELVRYFLAIGILALVVFVPLQMKLSWLPEDAPPVVAPSLVAVLALVAIIAICLFGALAYRSLWADGGWVDQELARHREVDHRRKNEGPGETPKG